MPAAVAIPLFIAGAGAIVGAGVTSIQEDKKVRTAEAAANVQNEKDALDLEALKQQTAIQESALIRQSDAEQSGINAKVGASGLEAGQTESAVAQDAFTKYAEELKKLKLNVDNASKQLELNKRLNALNVRRTQDNADSAVASSLLGGVGSFLNVGSNVGLFG
jgi:hypothetical protein